MEFIFFQKVRKKKILDKNLKAHLYNEEGNLLSEDYLRVEEESYSGAQSVVSYLPYHKEASTYQIVRLQRGRDKNLSRKETAFSQSFLIEDTYYYSSHPEANAGWSFDKERECHISHPSK